MLATLLTLTFLPSLVAGEARFFRIAGPVPTTITSVSPDGTVTWTNLATNATFTVQTATTLSGLSNWVDYIQVPASNGVTTHRIFDPHPPVGMAFIPGGSFTMGDSSDWGSSSLPLHSLYVSPFYMERTEVTKALWDAVYNWATNHGYSFDNVGFGKTNNHPVHTISWFDTVKWCNARSEKEGKNPAYYTSAAHTTVYRVGTNDLQDSFVNWNSGYRLPTESEWEKAARGGASERRFPWSDTDTIQHSRANYWSSSDLGYDTSPTRGYHPDSYTVYIPTNGPPTISPTPFTLPVGSLAANGYGLYDLAGNVSEWCWDWYDENYYSASPTVDPHGPATGVSRVNRGGGWLWNAMACRSAARSSYPPNWNLDGVYTLGFRCVFSESQ